LSIAAGVDLTDLSFSPMQAVDGYSGYAAITKADGVFPAIDNKPVKMVIVTKTGLSGPPGVCCHG